MKIAHFPGSFLPTIGGAEIIVHNLATEQANAGHTVHVIAHRKSRKFFEDIKIQLPYQIKYPISNSFGLACRLRKLGLPFNWIITKQIKWLQNKYHYDLWHFNLINEYAFIIVPFLKQLGVPVIGTFRGSDIQLCSEVDYGFRLDRNFDNEIHNIIGLFDTVTAISQSVKDEYKKLGVSEINIQLIPNGIDINRINMIKVNKNVARKKFGLPTNKKIILTVGRNHPKKGYIHIPSIIKYLNNKIDFIWVIIGKDCANIMERAKILGVNSKLIIKDEIAAKINFNSKVEVPSDDLIMAYKSADVFCFPTIIETFGNVFLEAMVAGLPIITTNAPGPRDIITNEYNGLISAINDNKTMSDNIIRVLNNKSLRKSLVENGIQDVKKYNWDKVTKDYEKVYVNTAKMVENILFK
jgi:glycosyltransferase involved in cell wall biosynthesis